MRITVLSLWAHKLFRPEEPQPFGGAELQLFLLSTTLAQRKDVHITFVTRGQGEYEEYEHKGIHVVKLPYHSSKQSRSIKGAYEIAKTCIKQPTDIYLQRAGGIETGILAIVARRKKKPFVYMSASNWDVDGTRVKTLGFFVGRIYRFGLRNASLVLTQTEEQQNNLFQHERISSEILRSAHEIPEEIEYNKDGILWISRCESLKCPEAFLALAERMPEVSFTMVCPKANSEEYFETISSRAAKIKNLKFLPGVSFDETERLFAAHRIFVCSSKYEGFPNTFVQALKWGTPVFSLYLDPDNRLADYGTGICSNGDFSKFSATVDFYNKNTGRLKNMIQNGRSYVREHHDVNKITEQLYNMLQNLLDQ